MFMEYEIWNITFKGSYIGLKGNLNCWVANIEKHVIKNNVLGLAASLYYFSII